MGRAGEPPCKAAREEVQPPSSDAHDDAWLAWARRWSSWDPNLSTRRHVSELAEAGDAKELRRLLSSRLEFGTAGLRGPMGSGSTRMNDLVVIQTTQGVCSYLERSFGESGKERGVCIGFDHRAHADCNSKSFAKFATSVFLHRGFSVYLYSDFVATPFVPWCMEQKGCCAGIMVTASHNPAADNGYKLYWANCAQIIPPHDAEIAKLIQENLEPWAAYDTNVHSNPRCRSPDSEMFDAYFERLGSLSLFRAENSSMAKAFPITYTAMHGVGHCFMQRAFDVFGHGRASLVGVTEQLEPDPAFPTVAFPNPEEGKGALKLACDSAKKAGSKLILANDPDADRLAVAEMTTTGDWHIFTGNELGSLLGHWTWRCWRLRNPKGDVSRVRMVGSTVSSKFLKTVADKEGFGFVETLTGFKWMGSKSAELREAGFEVLFSFEEAIGFCVGNMVKDKDGICAGAVFAEMAKQLHKEGKTCLEHLEDLYRTYGYFLSLNSYVKCAEPALTARLFEAQRRNGDPKDESERPEFPKEIGGYTVTGVRDLTVGYDSRMPDGVPDLPLNLGGEMITYFFGDHETQVTLRTSGTEPKIKWYSEMRSESFGEEPQKRLADLVRAVVVGLLDPMRNGLDIRPEDMAFFSNAEVV